MGTRARVMMMTVLLAVTSCTFETNRRVSLLPEHTTCVADTDCVLQATACSSCGESIAVRFSGELAAERDRLCRGYRGPVVDCPETGGPLCKAGQCTIAPPGWDPQSPDFPGD